MLIKGRAVALTVLDYGLFRVGNLRTIGIPGFVITTDQNEHILIDTGFPKKYAADAEAAAAQDGLSAFGAVMSLAPQNLVTGQLALMGLSPADITLLILTHSHIDHVGGIAHFAGKRIVLGAAEHDLKRPLYWGAEQPMKWPLACYVPVDCDTQIAEGIVVLHVPGHTPGQLAIEVHLPQTGRVVLTSDAISRPAEVAEGFAGALDSNAASQSAKRLMDIGKGSMVIFGHCPEQWPRLRKAPLAYY